MSNVIKAPFTSVTSRDKKVIGLQTFSNEGGADNVSNDSEKQLAQQLITDAKQEAKELLENANKQLKQVNEEIEQTKQAWLKEKQQLEAEAKETGYKAGFQSGEEAGYTEYSEKLSEAKHIVSLTKKDYHEILDSAEEKMLLIGIKVAERILGETLDGDEGQFVHIVKRALKEVKEHTDIKIYVHPSQYDLVISRKNELLDLLNHMTELYIYPDEDRKETGCIIESSFGKIDASVDSQLEEIKAKLIELLVEE
ncbi:flagellar assembly protein FliH [Bacillus sp. SCS-151]|uniref:flagellar assembly protein FliH n=1 Tax=Nanhaiella sioensis TaxID=3115293 RepID=UPI00397921BA